MDKEYSNFLINSKNKKKKDKIRFKGLNAGEFYQLPNHENGNQFEYSLYGGFYFENITIKLAKFFLNIEIIQNDSYKYSKINKLRVSYKMPITQCFFSSIRNIRVKQNRYQPMTL